MLPPKYSAVLLVGLMLCGCFPGDTTAGDFARGATTSELAAAHIKQDEAIRLAIRAFEKSGRGKGIGTELLPKAQFIKVDAYKKVPAHYKWWVCFVPRTPPEKPARVGYAGAYVDDETGHVEIQLGM